MKAVSIAAAIALSACTTVPIAPAEADLVIHNARLVDIVNESVGAPMMLVVDGAKVTYAGSDRADARGRRTIDARGGYVLPGLWDMHVHALWSDGLWPIASDAFLAHCITGVRDMGGTLAELARARRNPRPAPELIAAGLILDGPQPVDPDISVGVEDATTAEKAVNQVASGGADFVKVYTLLSPDAFAGVIKGAAAHRLDIAGHVPYGVDIVTAASHMRSIEHMQAETGLYCDPTKAESCSEAFTAFKTHGSWQTPTLAVRAVRAHHRRISVDNISRWTDRFPAHASHRWAAEFERWSREDATTIARKSKDFDRERQLARRLITEDVPMLAGSDSGLPMMPYGEGLAQELQLLVDSGATPAKALRSATVEPANYLRRKPASTVMAGIEANFCIVPSSPLQDVGAATRPWLTVARGRVGFERSLPSVTMQAR